MPTINTNAARSEPLTRDKREEEGKAEAAFRRYGREGSGSCTVFASIGIRCHKIPSAAIHHNP